MTRSNTPTNGLCQGASSAQKSQLEAAAERELRKAIEHAPAPTHLEQLRTYGAPGRDAHADRRVVSVAYLAIQPDLVDTNAGTGDAAAGWKSVDAILGGTTVLALDHAEMVRDTVEHLRSELEHTAIATAFFEGAFTEAQLRKVYEAVWGVGGEAGRWGLDAPNFHRALKTLSPPIIERVSDVQAATGGRPAALYQPSAFVRKGGPATRLERPIPRPTTAAPKRRVH